MDSSMGIFKDPPRLPQALPEPGTKNKSILHCFYRPQAWKQGTFSSLKNIFLKSLLSLWLGLFSLKIQASQSFYCGKGLDLSHRPGNPRVSAPQAETVFEKKKIYKIKISYFFYRAPSSTWIFPISVFTIRPLDRSAP